MKFVRTLLSSLPLAALLVVPVSPVHALDDLLITEFMADNDNTLRDDSGNNSDWIEIFNAGTNTVNLLGWYLTDTTSNPNNWWRFPSTNLGPGQFLLVYASGEDRRIPGEPLHTNFRIGNEGEYLALVKPDRVTIQSFYLPAIQVPDVSYGIPVVLNTRVLVTTGATARLTVPLNGNLGLDWTQPGFNDGSWASVNNGVGFEADALVAGSPTQAADSVAEFSGTQGQAGWFYGYWHKQADNNGIYEAGEFTQFPRGTGNVLSETNYWDGSRWDWPAGNPPWTELTASGGHPNADNGTAGRPTHWAIRRYVSEVAGPLRITGTLACNSSGGTCGDGVVGRVFVDGVEVFQRVVANLSAGYSIVVSANIGSEIDFVIDPGEGNNDFCDTATFTAVVRAAAGATVVADTIADWSSSGGQGHKNWYYGYFNRTTGGTYGSQKFAEFPFGSGSHSSGNFWNGESWKWFDGEPPFDTIGQVEMSPSIFPTGGTKGNEHWVIRRWVSEVSGSLQVDWHIGKKNLSGGGVVGTVYHNGTQRDTYTLGGVDFVGTNRTVTITGVQIGDFIDFAVSPGADVIGDLVFLNATVHGVGTLSNQFISDVGGLMTNINASAYLRIPFSVTDAPSISALSLRMKNDDGFIAYLNGVQVTGARAPEPAQWNSAATSSNPDADASQFQDYLLDDVKDVLVNGNNVLAIHGLNASATDRDFLLAAELIATTVTLNIADKRYFIAPTPGAVNGVGSTNIGPLITSVEHQPSQPLETEDLLVSARISATRNPLGGVSLYYRVMYGAESSVPMVDNGLNGDLLAGDGIYSAVISNTAYASGQMIRYYFMAQDTVGNVSRLPGLGDTNNASLYFGTVAQDPTLTSPLPVLHWFIPPGVGTSLDNGSAAARCTLFWKGELYDNVRFTRHGQSSTGFRKKSYNVDFNPDHHFLWADGQERVDDINWLNTYPDKAHMRNMLSYGIHADAGPRSPSHFVVPVRVQSNAVFYGTMHIVENGDDNYLERIGRDKNGALYKMYDTMTSATTAEKKTRRYEDRSDLQELISRSASSNPTNRNWIYDNVDVSETINFLAAMIVTANVDCCHKNYYVYRDTEGDGEWEMLPWDVDLSFGRNWNSAQTYWMDDVIPNNGLFVGGNATLVGTLFNSIPTARAMYLRRVRSLQDQLLQTNGTPVQALNFERQIDHWAGLLTPDALMDIQKWGTWGGGAQNIFDTNSVYWRPLPQSVQELKTNYLFRRREFVFTSKMNAASEFPDAQPTNATILIDAIEYNPSSGNQAEEYIRLVNPNNYAVDISGWRLTGAINHTFQGGVVIPRAGTSNALYVVPNKRAFRGRAVSPRGGQGHYVEGPYDGQLSARGETIYLSDVAGRWVATNVYQGNPSGPQQYLRITEIMYHPPTRPAGSPYDTEEFEYIELMNIGPTNLNLTGVHFTNGIDFNFTGSAVTELAPGAHVLVVRNLAAFSSRYGSNLNVAGQFSGILNNSGERIRLDDAVGEKILDFEYDNNWYPVTDGPGASLVIRNPNADWRSWDLKDSWRPSAYDFGSPAANDPAPTPVVPVIINELLTHTDLPQVDAIEILNPNPTEANIGGWFISDDFATPKKFRIPDGTTVPANSYRVFYESNSFGTGPNAFAISSQGDETYIFSGNGTNITGYFQGYEFAAAANGVSFGRYTNSQTNVHFVAQNVLTLGALNGSPRVGPVVISEINYRPVEPQPGVDNEIDEYIEIANITGATVELFDPANPANTWRLRGGADFDFPPNITLPPGGHLVLVSFNPAYQALLATFRARYSVHPSVQVLGPFSGQLDNLGEDIRLTRPDSPDAGVVPYIVVDEVDYSSRAPWPTAADGVGPSLQRRLESAYGNDPTNWVAVGPSLGIAYQPGGTPPTIITHPANTVAVVGRTAMLTVEVAGTAPFFYQWRLNGTNIYGANTASLTLPQLQPSQAGNYSVVVFNSAGSVESSSAALSVLFPPSIVASPVGRAVYIKPDAKAANLPNGTNVTFTILASSGNSAVSYQWRFNGVNIPGATTSSYTVTNVQVEDDGFYSCAVSDSVDTVESAPVRLTPLISPIITQRPSDLTVAAGQSFSFSVEATGHPLPFAYSWRRNQGSLLVNTNWGDYRSNFVTLDTSAIGLVLLNNILASNYVMRVVIYNQANPTPGATATATVRVVADSDQDGLPDYVELGMGLGTNNPADGAADFDLDGMSNRAEFEAGTDPTDSLSYLKIEQTITPGLAGVQVAVVSNRTYSVQYTDSLGGGQWSKLADIIARSTNRVESFQDSTWNSNRFYRVVLPQQP